MLVLLVMFVIVVVFVKDRVDSKAGSSSTQAQDAEGNSSFLGSYDAADTYSSGLHGHDDMILSINPATGLPMTGSVDAMGSSYGTDIHARDESFSSSGWCSHDSSSSWFDHDSFHSTNDFSSGFSDFD